MTFVFIVYQLFNVMNCRSNEESVFELGLFSNPPSITPCSFHRVSCCSLSNLQRYRFRCWA